ncbi:hypothetical protein [Chryseobacterium taklimakanense]|uniref:hypothetical protein n=1 Tax=Chryseobacterium taklimakanense TaxID=536441 RepID=UPI0013DDD961|nr:hypothetical protein [Chryseobacterium taklimakanense]
MIHRNFTFTEFFYISVFLLFLIFLFRIIKNQRQWSSRTLLISLIGGIILTILSLLYSEGGNSGMFEVKSYGFPRQFIEQMRSIEKPNLTGWDRTVFLKFNFIQNLILYFLLVLNVTNLLTRRKI